MNSGERTGIQPTEIEKLCLWTCCEPEGKDELFNDIDEKMAGYLET